MQHKFLRVQDDRTLVRDTANNAILASDQSAKQKFLENQKRELALRQATSLNSRVETLEESVNDIKKLLIQLIEQNNRSNHG